MFLTLIIYFSVGLFGSFVIEVIKLYELRGKLEAEKFSGLFKSKAYLWLTGAMMFCAGILACIVNAKVALKDANLFNIMLSGMGSCAVLRDMYAAKVQNERPILGNNNLTDEISLKEII